MLLIINILTFVTMRISRKRLLALQHINYNLFGDSVLPAAVPASVPTLADPAEPKPLLPPLTDLYEMFNRFNTMHFGGGLPPVKIRYSTRMLIAGTYSPHRHLITIGRRYHEIFSTEIPDTLLHEMIHIIHHRHDDSFRNLAGRLGVSIKAHEHPSLRAPHKFLYFCPACGREYPRRKRLRMASCGICSARGKFDPMFKLILKREGP